MPFRRTFLTILQTIYALFFRSCLPECGITILSLIQLKGLSQAADCLVFSERDRCRRIDLKKRLLAFTPSFRLKSKICYKINKSKSPYRINIIHQAKGKAHLA